MSEPPDASTSPAPGRPIASWLACAAALTASMAALAAVTPVTRDWQPVDQRVALTVVAMAAGVVFLVALRWLTRSDRSGRQLLWIVALGLALRLVLFAQPPAFETDFYRFMWDGAVTAHGANPYAWSPSDVIDGSATPFATEPRLISLREAGLPTLRQANHPHLTTIYPPVAQAFFAVAYWISPFDPNGIRWLILLAELPLVALIVALLRRFRLPIAWLAIYWWNPVAIKEFYFGAHIDVLSALLAMCAVAAAVWGRRWLGVALLALAIGAKLWPIVLAPLVLRFGVRSGRQLARDSLVFALLVACLTFPLLASWGRDSTSGVSAYAHHWHSNAGLFSIVNAAAEWAGDRLGLEPNPLPRLLGAGLFVGWCAFLLLRSIADARSLARWSMVAVGGMFLISPTQFPWYFCWALPFLAVAPSRALIAYSALLPLYHVQYDYPWVLWVQHVPVWLLLAWELTRPRPLAPSSNLADDAYAPPADQRVTVIIPALNEERAIGKVIAHLPTWVSQVIVVDNGSTDDTASVARRAGALVVHQPQRGYGAACLAGIAAADRPDVVVFLDGDFSDVPAEMSRLVAPIIRDEADLVIGSRVRGRAEAGSLTPQQRFGNALACALMRLMYGVRYTDLGPFRAIHAGALRRLAMDDQDFGWTVQMQIRAARLRMRSHEVPVSYRKRIGVSKISGTVRGVFAAGTKILSTLFREGWRRDAAQASREQVIVMARYPEPGKAKTRLIPLLGPDGAALLHRQLVRHTIAAVQTLACRRASKLEVRYTGGSEADMRMRFGAGPDYRAQSDGDLGQRLHAAAVEAFARGMTKVVLIGTDCPLLDAQMLGRAFDALDVHDVVLGPATDGGYYLIGMRSADRPLFEGIDWGGPTVLAQTIAACERIGARFTLLQELSDVDLPADLATWGRTCLARREDRPALSVVIPARNEASRLAATIASALTTRGVQIIVVDGNSTDRTLEVAGAFGVELISSVASRGVQLNAGAAVARADAILFLHADTLLPTGFAADVRQVLALPGVAAGAFDLAIDAVGWSPQLIELGVRLRSRLRGRPYGDQAMFMSRHTFDRCSGFPALAYMEDYAMLDRLHALGAVRIANKVALTSSRQWERSGWWLSTLRHQRMIISYRCGFGPAASRLAPPVSEASGRT